MTTRQLGDLRLTITNAPTAVMRVMTVVGEVVALLLQMLEDSLIRQVSVTAHNNVDSATLIILISKNELLSFLFTVIARGNRCVRDVDLSHGFFLSGYLVIPRLPSTREEGVAPQNQLRCHPYMLVT